jgi:hypothetical protein
MFVLRVLLLFSISLFYQNAYAQRFYAHDNMNLSNYDKTNGIKRYNTPLGLLTNGYILEKGSELKVSMPGSIIKGVKFGSYKVEKDKALWFDGTLKIISDKKLKKTLKITILQDQDTKEWLATDGTLAVSNDKIGVLDEHIIVIVGGGTKTVNIGGDFFSDCTVEIKNGKPIKKE